MRNKSHMFRPPCDECGAKCCEYTAIEIDKPSTKTDYDNIRWYLSHENVFVFVDHDRKWHVEFRARCEHLAEDRKCRIYQDRPMICRRHGMGEGECEYYDSPHMLRFSSIGEFEKYLSKKGIDWRFRGRDA